MIVLKEVTSSLYLGVTLTDNMKWDVHISSVCAKANNTLGFKLRET